MISQFELLDSWDTPSGTNNLNYINVFRGDTGLYCVARNVHLMCYWNTMKILILHSVCKQLLISMFSFEMIFFFLFFPNNRPFRSSAMVTRIAGMLNYFLVRLVAKREMGAFKVMVGYCRGSPRFLPAVSWNDWQDTLMLCPNLRTHPTQVPNRTPRICHI